MLPPPPFKKLVTIVIKEHDTDTKIYINEQSRTEDPGIRLQNYSHLILKRMLQIHRERTASSTNGLRERNLVSTYRRMELESYLSPCTRSVLNIVKPGVLGLQF